MSRGNRQGDKDLSKILQKLEKDGWIVETTKKSHYKVTNPEGGFTVLPGTIGGSRKYLDNFKAKLRRLGASI